MRVLLILVVLLFIGGVFAQSFDTLESSTGYSNFYINKTEWFNDSMFFYNEEQSIPSEDSLSLAEIDWHLDKMVLFNIESHQKVEKLHPSKSDSIVRINCFTTYQDTIHAIVSVASDHLEESLHYYDKSYFYNTYDIELNLLNQIQLLGIDSVIHFDDLVVDAVTNTLMTIGGQVKDGDSGRGFIAKYDLNGTLLDYEPRSSRSYHLFEVNDSLFVVSHYYYDFVYFYDNELNNIDFVDLFFEFSPVLYSGNGIAYDPISNSFYGVGYENLFDDDIYIEYLVKYDFTSNETSIVRADTLIDATKFIINNLSNAMGIRDSTIFYSNFLYCNLDNDCCLINHFNLSDCTNSFTYNSVKVDGTLNCSRILGGDAKYNVSEITGTPDGGSLVFLNRHKYLENDDGNIDLYYAKFDADCNLEADYLLEDTTMVSIADIWEQEDLTVFPNPTTDILYVDGAFDSDFTMIVYNLLGEIVKTHSFRQSNAIDISSFPSGVYFYEIKNKEQKTIKTGKVEKI